MNKKKFQLSISLLAIISLTGCASGYISASPAIKSENIVNLSKTNYLGSRFSVNINTADFKLKASSDGTVAATISQIKAYKVYLCTDTNKPLTTKITGSEFSFNRDTTQNNASVTFVNVPVGSYYAVVAAYDNTIANNFGKNLTKTVAYSIDGNQSLAVSSNFITVNSDLTLSPTNGVLLVTLNLQDAQPVKVDTSITNTEGNNGVFDN